MKIVKETSVGIDTGKIYLDRYIRPFGKHIRVEKNAKGIKEAIKLIKAYKPILVIIEATDD